ncbi:MAG: 50S ribosomal protein L9 [Sphaerochaetaceae bacterium]
MKLILNEDVHNLGEEGDVVVVKRGYGRNYLLPKGIAVPFNKANQALFATKAAAIEKRKEEKRKNASSIKERLDNLTLTLVVTAGDTGKLFGSVTGTMVQEALAKEGIDVERKRIEVESHAIKMVGSYTVRIRLYEGTTAEVKLEVVSEAELKKKQAQEAKAEKERKAQEAQEKKAKEAAEKEAAKEVSLEDEKEE